jgi:hypothetical protein
LMPCRGSSQCFRSAAAHLSAMGGNLRDACMSQAPAHGWGPGNVHREERGSWRRKVAAQHRRHSLMKVDAAPRQQSVQCTMRDAPRWTGAQAKGPSGKRHLLTVYVCLPFRAAAAARLRDARRVTVPTRLLPSAVVVSSRCCSGERPAAAAAARTDASDASAGGGFGCRPGRGGRAEPGLEISAAAAAMLSRIMARWYTSAVQHSRQYSTRAVRCERLRQRQSLSALRGVTRTQRQSQRHVPLPVCSTRQPPLWQRQAQAHAGSLPPSPILGPYISAARASPADSGAPASSDTTFLHQGQAGGKM